MSKKVSIIMGIYNCEETIEEAIDSIISQTYTEWDLILCDDNSTDRTYEIANQYSKKYPDKIKLIRNKANMKLAATLNRCLECATGDYIARMDSDDKSMPNRLEKQVNFLIQNPEYDLVGSQMTIFSGSDILGKKSIIELPDRYTQRFSNPFAHPTIMARKRVFDILGGYNTSKETQRCEDVELWFRFYEYGFKGYNIQETLYQYREDRDALNKRKLKHGIDCAKIYYQGFKRLNYPKRYYIYILKPIISSCINKSFLQKYQLIKGKRMGGKM